MLITMILIIMTVAQTLGVGLPCQGPKLPCQGPRPALLTHVTLTATSSEKVVPAFNR